MLERALYKPVWYMQKTVVLIAGPTASGKTDLAVALARQLQTEIISADSRQCFRELEIGVAKPPAATLSLVQHHFINSHSIHEKVTAAHFEQLALATCEKLFQQHDVVVMAGGTGLYIRAFCQGLDEIPAVPIALRQELIALYEQRGLAWLQAAVQTEDPLFASSGEMQNPQRLLRALEVIRGTGRSLLSFHRSGAVERPFRIIRIGLHLPRVELYERINLRVEKMMEQGLEQEARALYPYAQLNALQTVGYAELFAAFDGTWSMATAVEKIKQHTRHYAKRQLTWFQKDTAIQWMDAQHPQAIIAFVKNQLEKD